MRAVLILVLLTTACVTDGDGQPEPVPPPEPVQACDPGADPFRPDHFYFIQFGTMVFRQGATIPVTPRADNSPAGQRALALQCTSDWAVRGPATLAPDRRSVTIAPDAPPGSLVGITLRYGSQEVGGSFRVIGREEVVLTGRRSQRSAEGCENAEPVRELEFAPDNRFSVTFRPFESYQDYWGTYRFDSATGALRMEVAGGNNVPAGLDLEGTARLDGEGRLILEDMFLGDQLRGFQPPPGGCRYTF